MAQQSQQLAWVVRLTNGMAVRTITVRAATQDTAENRAMKRCPNYRVVWARPK